MPGVWPVLIIVLLALGFLLAFFVARTWWLTRNPGVFDSALALPPNSAPRPGWGRYRSGTLEWCSLVSLGLRPRHVWRREGFDIISSEPISPPAARDAERRVLVQAGGMEFALVVSAQTSAALRSWIESGPPSWESVERPGRRTS